MRNNNWMPYTVEHLTIDTCKEIIKELEANNQKCQLYSIIYENGKKYAKIKVFN